MVLAVGFFIGENDMAVIERVKAFAAQWLALTDGQLTVLATWIAATHLVERWESVPYLQVSGTMPGTGKTQVLKVIEKLAPLASRPMVIRPAAIVREIAEASAAHDGKFQLVMLFDEAERLSSGRTDDTRACLATGYSRGATWPVSKGTEVIKMPSFGFKAFALIGDLQPVLRARCIMLDMEPGKTKRKIDMERTAFDAEASELQAELHAVAQGVNGAHRPADWLDLRHAEIWTPIMTTAALMHATADTVRTLERASIDLTALHRRAPRPHLIDHDRAQDAEHARMSTRLVADAARIALADDPAESAMFSADLLAGLKDITTAPWRNWPNETGLDERALAGLLARHGVLQPVGKSGEPSPVQRGKGRAGRRQARGYKKGDIIAAAKRIAAEE
jgi:hypothetical protein